MILIGHKHKENIKQLEQIFKSNNTIHSNKNFSELLNKLEENLNDIQVILLSTTLIKDNIKDALQRINILLQDKKIPIFLIINEYLVEDEQQIFEAYNNGVIDIIEEPIKPYILKVKIKNIINLYKENEELKKNIIEEEESKLSKLLKLVSFSSNKESQISKKSENIRKITENLLKELNKQNNCKYSENEIKLISMASQLYDIGKFFIKVGVKEEYTIKGAKIIKKYLDDKELAEYAYNIALLHNERIDGQGGPYKLLGDKIPLYCQVVGIADVYNTLLNQHTFKESIQKIKNKEYGKFSMDIINILEKKGENIFNLSN